MTCTPLVPLVAALCAGCSDPPPRWCTAAAPLEASCAGPQCVAAVIVDYRRVEPRGYRVFTVSGTAVNRQQAEARAVDHVQRVLGAVAPEQSDTSQAGDFYVSWLRYATADTWLVVVHAPTGQVLFAGLEVWGDPAKRGYDFPLPAGFRPSTELGCVDAAAEPETRRFVTTGIPFGSPPASTAAEAWGVAHRLNLTADFTSGHRYSAMVVSYAPAVGELDPEATDWYVWLNRF